MNSTRLFLTFTILAVFFTLAFSPLQAGGMGNGAAQRMKLVVDSVDAAGGTIALKSQVDNSVHTYKFDGKTQIVIRNVKGTVDQIQVGEKVVNFRAGPGEAPQTLQMLMVWPETK